MPQRVPCEFFLVRYVPDVVKGEFVNIGVVLREAAGAGDQSVVRFTRDWRRVQCIHADADTEMFEGLEKEIGARLKAGVSDRDPKGVLEVLEDSLSNSWQISSVRACLAESLSAEVEQLMKLYVEPMRVKKDRGRTGRAAIVGVMRTEFERGKVWSLMRKRIPASQYTGAGDPMRIDCGYGVRVGNEDLVRMFHAVSLEGDVDAAKGLAYSAAGLRDGVARVHGGRLELSAVVEPLREVADPEDGKDEGVERYRFGVEAMEREAIRVVTLNDLARVAATARMELRV